MENGIYNTMECAVYLILVIMISLRPIVLELHRMLNGKWLVQKCDLQMLNHAILMSMDLVRLLDEMGLRVDVCIF
jgi:hypothetical protein